MSGAPWEYGDLVVRREVLKGHPWVGFPTYVVEDSEDLLAVLDAVVVRDAVRVNGLTGVTLAEVRPDMETTPSASA